MRFPMLLAIFLVMTALFAGDARAGAVVELESSCRYSVSNLGFFGNGSSTAADIVGRTEASRLVLLGSNTMPDGTAVVGGTVSVFSQADIDRVAGAAVTVSPKATVRNGIGEAPEFPLDDPACIVPEPVLCGEEAVSIAKRTVAGPLAAGSYSRLVVHSGARLELERGSFQFCSVQLGRGATLVTAGVGETTLEIRDAFGLRKGAVVEPDSGGEAAQIVVEGTRVQLSAESKLDAYLSAPSAKVRVGKFAELRRGACSGSLAARRSVSLGCSEPSCGDGRLDAATEQCDAPQDGACLGACLSDCSCPAEPGPWRFVDVTDAAGARTRYTVAETSDLLLLQLAAAAGGVAAGDYDGDGFVDLYTVGGALDRSRLLRNLGDGTFDEVSEFAGVDVSGEFDTGPIFADYDGDGDLDLLVGGAFETPLKVYRNLGDGTFEDATEASEILSSGIVELGLSFGDYDGDQDLDLFVTHWIAFAEPDPPFRKPEHLWRNDGDGTFSPATQAAGLVIETPVIHYSFTGTFADTNSDARPDLLLASDFGTEQYFLNDGDTTFTEATSSVNSAENAMGQAVADYDNDGDLDWFISSIWDPDGFPEANWGTTGNRLYRNDGSGVFSDATDEAGVREGYWGWGSCFADFNLDGHLDLFHVNGYDIDGADTSDFEMDPSRLFLSNGDGTFTERSAELGLIDTEQGRGVVCFDYDRDGDIDLFIANGLGGDSRLYRNDLVGGGNYLAVTLRGQSPNTEAAGARVVLTAGGVTQMREIQIGSNYLSQNPAIAHFGVGDATTIGALRVEWTDGSTTNVEEALVNSYLVIEQP